MTLTRVVMIRLGESQVTVNKILGGPRSCTGLSELGRLQAQRLRDRLTRTGEISADVLYSSAYSRARQTAEILRQSFGGMEVTIDADFGEHDPVGMRRSGSTNSYDMACPTGVVIQMQSSFGRRNGATFLPSWAT